MKVSILLFCCALYAHALYASPPVAPPASTDVSRHSLTPRSATWTGWATWYNRASSGPTMANGQPLDERALTCALPWRPDGRQYRVTTFGANMRRSVVVRHTDRGPAQWTGNAVDLTPAAFRKLANLGRGKVMVKLEAL